ncbi:hypothetical protein MMC08_004392, partial [Hypocenomyce scalaris]|nr:hypothetical protein [Hypocenomyce scalaris]
MGNPVVTNANETSDGASKATSNRTVTTVGWVSDPNGRGTSSLVITCVLTLGLCVWSAIHLNVPPKNESRVQYGTRYVKWSLMGVLAPELVVWTAWRQWNSAKTIQREVNKAFENEETPPTTPLVNSDKDLSK